MKTKKTLLLTALAIRKLVSMKRALRIVEEAFAACGAHRVQMPPKIYIRLDKYGGDLRAMPAYIEGLEACGIKWVNVHPGNRRHGLPVVMASIILNDPSTGFPVAIMDGTHITNLRTGAAGGVAAKYLANKKSSRLGLVGCGVQAYFQLMALMENFEIEHLALYDKEDAHAQDLARKAARMGLKAQIAKDVEECVRDKDMVVSTTTSRRPIIKAGWISQGTHINAIGADARGKEELEPALLKKATVVVDDITQATHSGEINVPISEGLLRPSDICATIGEVVYKKKRLRRSPGEITIFDSTGLAIQDMALASYIYSRAKKMGSSAGLIKINFIK